MDSCFLRKAALMIKLVFCDMDGTLLDERGDLPEGLGAILAELKARGVLFAPASGRQYAALLRHFRPWAADLLFCAENGAYVVQRDEELFSTTIEPPQCEEIVRRARTVEGAYIVWCGKEYAYVTSRNEAFFTEMEKYYTEYKIVEDFSAVHDTPVKFSVCDPVQADAERTIYPSLASLEGDLKVVVSSNYWVDIMRTGVNKGAAVRRVQQLLGIRPEECLAFGDYLNDIEMLGAVGESYAMENAHPAAKAAAKHIAPSNREHGVLRVLRRLLDEGKM